MAFFGLLRGLLFLVAAFGLLRCRYSEQVPHGCGNG